MKGIIQNVSIQPCVLFSWGKTRQDSNLLKRFISQAALEAAKNAHKVQAFGVFQVDRLDEKNPKFIGPLEHEKNMLVGFVSHFR